MYYFECIDIVVNFEKCVNIYFARENVVCGQCHRKIGSLKISSNIGIYINLYNVRLIEQKQMKVKLSEGSVQMSSRLVGISNNLKRKSSLEECPVPEKRMKFNNLEPIVLMRVATIPTDIYDEISLMDFDADEIFQEIGMFEGPIEIDDLMGTMFGPNPIFYTNTHETNDFGDTESDNSFEPYTPPGEKKFRSFSFNLINFV